MLTINLGRRYERLLFAAAPLCFFSMILLFIAIASTTQKDRVTAQCYEQEAVVINKNESSLEKEWLKAQPVTKDSTWAPWYRLDLVMSATDSSTTTDCFQIINAEMDERYRNSPADIAIKLDQDAAVLNAKPLALYGVEIPEKSTINIFGIGINISLTTLSRIIQITLAPLLILWLGSLYNTRYREAIEIGEAEKLSEIFPHVINVYPVTRFPNPRKRNYLTRYFRTFNALMYTLTRVALLGVFVVPTVVAYDLSLYMLHSDAYTFLLFLAGFLVSTSTLTVIVVEFMPWHYNKIFSWPDTKP